MGKLSNLVFAKGIHDQTPFLEGGELERVTFKHQHASPLQPFTGPTLLLPKDACTKPPTPQEPLPMDAVVLSKCVGLFGADAFRCEGLVLYGAPGPQQAKEACGGGKVTVVAGFFNGEGTLTDEANYLTLSCPSGAVSECITWGYFPKTTAYQKKFEACVRMARADYCGKGRQHTEPSTPIDVSSDQEAPSCVKGMCREAQWHRDGAVCIEHVRWNMVNTAAVLLAECPHRFDVPGEKKAKCKAAKPPWLLTNRSMEHYLGVNGQVAQRACSPGEPDPDCP